MTQDTFYLDKSTGTFADALAAFGLAVVLDNVLQNCGHNWREVRLSDGGAFYALTCLPAIQDDWLQTCEPFVAAPFLRTLDKKTGKPRPLPPGVTKAAGGVVDYEAEKEKRAEYFEARKHLPQEARVASARREEHPALAALADLEPHRDWDIFRAINPNGLAGYNGLMSLWWEARDRKTFPDLLRVLLGTFAQTPNDLDGAEVEWAKVVKARRLTKPKATALQIYNPHQGKGQNRAKPDALTMGNVDNFWMLEWLKAVGLYRAGLTKQLSKTKDRKTYVLAPHDLALEHSDGIMQEFRRSMVLPETAIRSDILAALRYTRAFLSYCEQRPDTSLFARLMGGRGPRDFVAGLRTAFYKDLGNSAATMNLAFIALPGWVKLWTPADIGRFNDKEKGVLAEHEAIVRQFDESHGDDYDLLLRYRDFISGNDLGPFFEFAVAYSAYIISQREKRGGRARQFTTDNLEVLIMSSEPRLTKILESPGFQNIAYAIRQSTVTAQYRKQQGDRRYDVRYGLGLELARKANYAAEFVAALSDFLHKYNAENAQVMENRAGPYRRSVQTRDIDAIVALVDEYGAPLVCNLLVAYGYAREPRKGEPGEKDIAPDEVPGDETAGEDDTTGDEQDE